MEAAKKSTVKKSLSELSEMAAKWQQEMLDGKTIPIGTASNNSTVMRVAQRILRSESQLFCAVAAMSCERYRLKHKRWPVLLDSLVNEGLLTKVPIDPYDGKPLRYRQTKNGIIVYSIGDPAHGQNKGDSLDNPDLQEPRKRIEFRLWNPDKRRQPPRPRKQKDDILR